MRKNKQKNHSSSDIVVATHAKEQYIRRHLGLPNETKNRYYREQAKEDIIDVVERPDNIVQTDDKKPQVHMNDNIAVPVGVSVPWDDKLHPYDDLSEGVIIPTVYNSQTFKERNEQNS